jgi:hypothetical protein
MNGKDNREMVGHVVGVLLLAAGLGGVCFTLAAAATGDHVMAVPIITAFALYFGLNLVKV